MASKKSTITNLNEFGEYVNEHQTAVRACIRILGIPTGYVDDIAQETFLIAYKKFGEYDHSRSMRSWLLGIARKLVINERRKVARRFKLLNENLTDLLHEEAISVAQEYEAAEKLKVIKTCINSLPERNKTILNLKFEAGKTAASIAVRLERDSSTIRHLLARTITSLKRCVHENGGVLNNE